MMKRKSPEDTINWKVCTYPYNLKISKVKMDRITGED